MKLLGLVMLMFMLVLACGGAGESVAPPVEPQEQLVKVVTPPPTATALPPTVAPTWTPVPTFTPVPTWTSVPTWTAVPTVEAPKEVSATATAAPIAMPISPPTLTPTATPVLLPMDVEHETVTIELTEEEAMAYHQSQDSVSYVYHLFSITNPNDEITGFYSEFQAVDDKGLSYSNTGFNIRLVIKPQDTAVFQIWEENLGMTPHEYKNIRLDPPSAWPVPHSSCRTKIMETRIVDGEEVVEKKVKECERKITLIENPSDNEFFSKDGTWFSNKTDGDLQISVLCENTGPFNKIVGTAPGRGIFKLYGNRPDSLRPVFTEIPKPSHFQFHVDKAFTLGTGSKVQKFDFEGFETGEGVSQSCDTYAVVQQYE